MTNTNNNTNSLNKIFLGVAIVELVIIIFLLIQLKQKNDTVALLNQTINTKSTEVEDKTKELETIRVDLERVKEERAGLQLNNDSLDIQINQLGSYISQLKKTKKLDIGKRKELESLVAKLRNQITKQDLEISTLKASNDSLTTDVTRLNTEKTKLGDSLSNVSNKQKEVESKLAYAAILKAENVKISVLKSNGKEISEDDNIYKASKIARLKVAFSLADNRAAKQNTKDVFVRLKTPDGDVFSDPNNGGGFMNLADGSPLSYTLKQSLKFDNSNQKMELITPAGLKYVPGFYKVEIYSEGYKIGEGSFKVK